MKKTLAMLLALVLLLSCASAFAEYEEKLTIRISVSSRDIVEDVDTSVGVWGKLSEMFNVEFVSYPTSYLMNAEQFTMRLATGDLPDTWIDWNWRAWEEQGIIRHYPIEWVQEYMPFMWEKVFSGIPTIMSTRTAEDGQLIGIPYVQAADANQGYARVYRQDWLDNLGLAVPTTLDELTEVMRAFTEDDPDGNGEDDTYGCSIWPLNQGSQFGDVFHAFGSWSSGSVWLPTDDNEDVYWSPSSEDYKNALMVVSDWYAKGYIDPEGLTHSQEDYVYKFSEGKVGSLYTDIQSHGILNTASALSALVTKYPDTPYVWAADPVVGPDGESGGYAFSPDLGWSVMFGLDVSDEVVKRMLAIYDFASTPEGYLFLGGEEGVDWSFTEDGMALTNPEYTNADMFTKGIRIINSWTTPEILVYQIGNGDFAQDVIDIMDDNKNLNVLEGFELTKCKEAGIGQDIGRVVDEFKWNCIVNGLSVEENWDAYLADLEANGLSEMTAEANEIWDTIK